MAVFMQDMADVILGEDRMIADLGDAAAEKLSTGGVHSMRAKRSGKVDGKSPAETGACVELHSKRVFVLRTKCACDIRNMRKRGQRNVDRRFIVKIE